ncbi:MAG TPA: hypothetical protein VKT82_05665 [Ktedonobacterales bacterium]|nr:hypothetical protein [Ktedonobacterales bacterium]
MEETILSAGERQSGLLHPDDARPGGQRHRKAAAMTRLARAWRFNPSRRRPLKGLPP